MYWMDERVGTASATEIPNEYHHIADKYFMSCLDMVDGKNDPMIIYQKLKIALNQWCLGRKVIFFCFAGISRSNGMATTLIAYYKNIDWEDAYTITRKACPRAQVCLDFSDSAKIALQMMRERLVKRCPFCNCPMEQWEEACNYCYHIHVQNNFQIESKNL